MKELIELVHIITRNKTQSIEIIGDSSNPNSKIEEFYQKICNQEFLSDEDAAQYFYETDQTNPIYKNLKSRLKSRLLNTVFFIDVNKSTQTDWQKAYYKCYRDWAAVKILLGKQARNTAISICHQLLKQGKKYEFTELVMDIARILRLHYGTRKGSVKKFREYNELYKTHAKIWEAENLAEELYTELVSEYVITKAAKEEIHQKAKDSFKQLEEQLQSYASYRLHLCGRLIELLIYLSDNDYQQTLRVCRETIHFFEQKVYTANVPLEICLHHMLVCHIQLRQFEEGKRTVKKGLELTEEGSFNWFKHQELFFLLSLHTRQYRQAHSVYEHVTTHFRFKFLPANLQELWRIFEAYIHYLHFVQELEIPDDDKSIASFRLGKFLNETPIFSKDKRGMNIPILIVQILFMIAQKQYDKAIDRIEAVDKYCNRYLIKDDTYRSNCFIKMLLQIPSSSFHRVAAERKAERYLDKLQHIPINVTQQAYEIEIIPYEYLWKLALDSLENKFHRPFSAVG